MRGTTSATIPTRELVGNDEFIKGDSGDDGIDPISSGILRDD
jgi:hypothetical protein